MTQKLVKKVLQKDVIFLDLVYIHTRLATLPVTIKLIITSSHRMKQIKIKRFVASQKRLWPAINFRMRKWPATLKRLGRPAEKLPVVFPYF